MQAEEWAAKMSHQPGKGWDSTITYCGWRDVPSVYILAEEDKIVPAQVQEMCAGLAGSKIVKVQGAGHMLQISRTKEVAGIVRDVVEGKY